MCATKCAYDADNDDDRRLSFLLHAPHKANLVIKRKQSEERKKRVPTADTDYRTIIHKIQSCSAQSILRQNCNNNDNLLQFAQQATHTHHSHMIHARTHFQCKPHIKCG